MSDPEVAINTINFEGIYASVDILWKHSIHRIV